MTHVPAIRGTGLRATLATVLTLASLPAHAEPMTFKSQHSGGNCNGCSWIAASGEITADTPDDFRAFLAEYGELYPSDPVTFDSPGGNLGAAIQLGRLLREAHATTAIGRSRTVVEQDYSYDEQIEGGRCESACVFAFLGGEVRYFWGEKLGIHQFFTADGRNIPTAATQQIMGQIVMYLIEMGISPELLTLASRIPGDAMHHLTRDEAERLGIGTSEVRSPMRLEVAQGGLVARWETVGEDGSLDRDYTLRCSQEQQAWLLDVLDTDIHEDNVVISAQNAQDIRFTSGGQSWQMGWSDLLDLGPRGSDYGLTARLPLDLRDLAGQEFAFHNNDARNFMFVLSAQGTLPDRATLDTMVRACGD